MGAEKKNAESDMARPSATCFPVNADLSELPAVWPVGPGERLAYVTVQTDTTDVPCGLYWGSLTVGTAIPVPAPIHVGNASPAA